MPKAILVCMLGLLAFTQTTTPAESLFWQSLAPGISYREFFLPQPNHLYVTRLDRANPEASIEVSLANGSLTGGLEPLSSQASRYDEALGYWDGVWGGRYRVVAAINGGFYDPETGLAVNALIQSGWYAKRFDDRQTVGGFAWGFDRRAFVTECVVQRPGKQVVALSGDGGSIVIDGINIPREDNQVIVYTPQFGAFTPSTENGLEVLVELNSPLGLNSPSQVFTGTVTEVLQDTGENWLPFDHIVLSANGDAAKVMKPAFVPGAQIAISLEARHLDQGCRKEREEALEGIYAALAGSYVFLRQGEIQPLNDLGSVLRNPRTAVALNDRYVYFMVVDGRDQLRSLGMSMVELGLFAKLHLGAVWGVAMDGGGSSTMVVDGEVRNNPNAETIVRAKPDKQPRAVADGLMMVLLQPVQRSSRYLPGEEVVISDEGDANLRLGPGTNYAPFTVLSIGTRGKVVEHPLNGVLAKSNYWWKVEFGEQVGWVSEFVLQPQD